MRLNKFLATATGLSRRAADTAIEESRVLVNNEIVSLGAQITDNDEIKLDNKIVPHKTEKIIVALNKPIGYLSSKKSQGDVPTLYELLPEKYQNLKTVGRLDKDSSGLILLTNDGDFAHQMTHPSFHKTKIYMIELDKPLEPLHQQMISDFGIDLADGISKLGLEKISNNQFRVIMSEGRNRQIRRTFKALGYTVIKLHRTDFGKYSLNGLADGECKLLD